MAEDNLENNIESDASSFIDDIKNTEDQVDPSVGRIASFVEVGYKRTETTEVFMVLMYNLLIRSVLVYLLK